MKVWEMAIESGIPVTLLTLLITIAAFTAVWAVSAAIRNVGVVDFYWGLGFLVIAGVHAAAAPRLDAVDSAIVIAVALWALRIVIYTGARFFGEAHEDPRYAAFRADAGPGWWWMSFFKVFLVQAVLLFLFAAPIHANFLSAHEAILMPLLALGALVFLAGFLIETFADLQLSEFRANPANQGRVMAQRLWKYSRHPNYFGEVVVWVGITLMAYAGGAPWWAILGPVLLALALWFISIPLTEAHLERSRPAYAEYRRRVSTLVPMRPRATDPGRLPAE